MNVSDDLLAYLLLSSEGVSADDLVRPLCHSLHERLLALPTTRSCTGPRRRMIDR